MLKKILHRYMSGKKFLTPERFGKKFFPQLNQQNYRYPTLQTSNGHVNHLGCEGRNGFDTLADVIHQQNGWRAFTMWCMVFNTKVLHFKLENTPIKDTNGKRKFKRKLSFLFVDKRKLFAMRWAVLGCVYVPHN